MDHLGLPRNPILPQPEVDYLCHTGFKLPIGPLLDYPSQRGLITKDVMRGDLSGITGWEMEGLAQEWIFFGLLSKVLEVPGMVVAYRDFVKKGQFDQDVLSTVPLPQYIEEWRIREEKLPEMTRQHHANLVEKLLNDAKLIVSVLSRGDYNPQGPGGFVNLAMCEALNHAANAIYGTLIVQRANFWPRSPWPTRRMLSGGWCPNRVQMLRQLLSSSAMYYASALDMNDSKEGKHNNCSRHQCVVHNLDRDTYQPAHISPSCESDPCSHLGPLPQTLSSALRNGGIPLIRIIDGRDKESEIETIETTLENCHSYVALSHVWSDGRGNLQANSLPICQLKHLQEMVSGVAESEDSGPPFFWLDTLCVPFQGEYRKVAISRMRRTYENATKVLVLSSELEVASSHTTAMESLMRISCSGWMRRLWTLQEGALAKKLYFRFKEQSATISDLTADCIKNDYAHISNPCSVDSMRCLDHFQLFKNCGKHSVLELIEAVQWRNTSWKQDEPVCMSILLDLDTEKIERTDPEERMPELLNMMKTFPTHLMFAPGRRLQKKGFGWSPSSFMPPHGFGLPDPQYASPLAMQSKMGLITTLPGLLLPLSKTALKQTAWFKIEDDNCHYRLTNMGEKEDNGPSWSVRGPHNINNPAVVLGGSFQQGREDDHGVLVSISYDDGKSLISDFVSRVFISKENGEFPEEVMQNMLQVESRKAEVAGGNTAVLVGEACHIPSRIWCIQ